MKKLFLLPLGLALISLVACGGQEQSTQQEETKENLKKVAAPIDTIADKNVTREYLDTLNGNVYHIIIERRHDEDLPIVEDALGTRFYDNVVTVVVKEGNKETYRRTFHKKQFLEFLSEEDFEDGTLAGIGYFEEFSTDKKLIFTSQVCVPGMDGGTFLKLELSTTDWKLKIQRDETADIDLQPLEEEGV